jgi:hypothetical protein
MLPLNSKIFNPGGIICVLVHDFNPMFKNSILFERLSDIIDLIRRTYFNFLVYKIIEFLKYN